MTPQIERRHQWPTGMAWLVLLLVPWSMRAQSQSHQAQSQTQATTRASRSVTVRVEAETEACPGRELLEAALQPVFVDASIRVTTAVDTTVTDVTVRDLGDSYVIHAGTSTRTVNDPTRDCVERARVTAVFSALNLHAAPTTQTSSTTIAPSDATTSEAAVEPEVADDERGTLRTGVGIAVLAGAQLPTSKGQLVGGAGLGVAWIAGAWRLSVDGMWLSSSTQALEGDALSNVPEARVNTTRLPLTLSVAHLFSLGAVSLGPSVGAVLDVLWMRGEQVMRPQRETRINLGARLSLEGRVHLSRAWRGVVQLSAFGYPRVYRLSVQPTGEAGTTPRLWIGANLGLEWHFGEFDSAD